MLTGNLMGRSAKGPHTNVSLEISELRRFYCDWSARFCCAKHMEFYRDVKVGYFDAGAWIVAAQLLVV